MPLDIPTIERYARFRGDSDMWSRSAEGQADPEGADNWRIIDELLMKLQSSASVAVSPEFKRELEAQLFEHAPSPLVLERLHRLVAESARW
jgi:hypothetical protein